MLDLAERTAVVGEAGRAIHGHGGRPRSRGGLRAGSGKARGAGVTVDAGAAGAAGAGAAEEGARAARRWSRDGRTRQQRQAQTATVGAAVEQRAAAPRSAAEWR